MNNNFWSTLDTHLDDLKKVAKAKSLKSYFSLGTTKNIANSQYFFSALRYGENIVSQNLMITDLHNFNKILNVIDGEVDIIAFDAESKIDTCQDLLNTVSKRKFVSTVTFFQGNRITTNSFENYLTCYMEEQKITLNNKKAFIVGCGHLGSQVAQILCEHHMQVHIYRRDFEKGKKIVDAINVLKTPYCRGSVSFENPDEIENTNDYLLLIGASNGIPVLESNYLDLLSNDGVVFDLGIRTLKTEFIEKAIQRNVSAYSVMSHAGYQGQFKIYNENIKLLNSVGRKTIDDISIISGGYIGKFGDIIVDNIHIPKRIIGIAKGNGLVLSTEEKKAFSKQITKIENLIKEN